MAGVVHIPWYATLFRGDAFADAVSEVAAASIRYGATQYRVHRSREDRYRILQMVWFESRLAWERYWEGPEMTALRTNYSGRYQVPVVYAWHDELAQDVLQPDAAAAAPAAV
ncbi:MAG TPA: hypothetical protein VFF79_13510 [Conexibacter sp.]|jgi:hypothetical protein|nr:hypothetical protein [Conexibacter sp.]